MNTIVELLKNVCRKYPDNLAVKQGSCVYNWQEVNRLSDRYAAFLQSKGILQGEHVGLMDYNSLNWVIAFFAIVKLGGIATLYNGNYKKRELSEVIQLSRTTHLCVGNAIRQRLSEEVSEYIHQHPKVFLMEPDEETLSSYGIVSGVQAEGDDTACYIFTTGSTARPKCVTLSNRSLVINAEVMARKMKYTGSDRICVSTPLFHIFSLVCNLLAAMTVGAALILPDSINSAGLIRCIEKELCTVFNGVPTSFLAMISNPEFVPRKVASVRVGTMGGAKVNRPQMENITASFPAAEFMINYGSTEAGFACNTDEGDGVEITGSSVGRPMEHMEIAIADLSTGDFLPFNNIGEILVRGSGIMDGYYGLPKEEQAIDENGYLHTGDVGFMDQNGRVTITDRIKNIINRGGENISPSEIESVIAGYEPVLDVVVIGVPNDVLGEEPVAFILTKKGMVFQEDELRRILMNSLAKYKIPRKILLLDQFPLTANGKKDILTLKQLAGK